MSGSLASAEPRKRGTGGWRDAVLMYRQPAVLSMLFLGFSAGLPFMLVFSTLSAWLRQAGIERSTIGMLAWASLAYTFKFLWSPVVDRFALPLLDRWLGRRRSWMLVAQIAVAIGLFNASLSDPAHSIFHVVVCALFIAFSSATQDIALDAWRIESAPVEMQGGMSAAYQLGYRVAIMAATAGALWIAADHGWHVAYMAMAALMSVGIITTLLIKEPERRAPQESVMREKRVIEWLENRAHWPQPLRHAGSWLLGAVVCPVLDFFGRYGLVLGITIFAFIGTYRLTDYAMGVMANPFYLDMGFTLKQVATIVKGYGLVMSLTGVVVGGICVAKLGRVKSLVLGSVLVMCSNFFYATFASFGETNVYGLACIISFDNLALGVHGTALVAFMSTLTSASYTATQYAVLSSLYALPGKLLMGASGIVVDAVGYTTFFVYTALLSIPALILLFWLARNDERKVLS
jgi:PAT family beta-lactamase induction signal transducer AmpG